MFKNRFIVEKQDIIEIDELTNQIDVSKIFGKSSKKTQEIPIISNLNLNQDINYIELTTEKKDNIIFIDGFMSKKTLNNFYESMPISDINYLNTAWGNYYDNYEEIVDEFLYAYWYPYVRSHCTTIKLTGTLSETGGVFVNEDFSFKDLRHFVIGTPKYTDPQNHSNTEYLYQLYAVGAEGKIQIDMYINDSYFGTWSNTRPSNSQAIRGYHFFNCAYYDGISNNALNLVNGLHGVYSLNSQSFSSVFMHTTQKGIKLELKITGSNYQIGNIQYLNLYLLVYDNGSHNKDVKLIPDLFIKENKGEE